MIERLSIQNYRCFEDFSLDFVKRPSLLLIGKNGSGKTTIMSALKLLQALGRNQHSVAELVTKDDFAQRRTVRPIRFEVVVRLQNRPFKYNISLEMKEDLGTAHIAKESVSMDEVTVFSRDGNKLQVRSDLPTFGISPTLTGLRFVRDSLGVTDYLPLSEFLDAMILLAPIPAKMTGHSSNRVTSRFESDASNIGSVLNELLTRNPASYNDLARYLREMLPDFASFSNKSLGTLRKQLSVEFGDADSGQNLILDFSRLSDGEKCMFLSAIILASNKLSPLFCMWDEPDNYLAISEVGHFVMELRKIANRGSQFLATSHHPESIRKFSEETTLVFKRECHTSSTVVRTLAEVGYQGDLISALIRGDILE